MRRSAPRALAIEEGGPSWCAAGCRSARAAPIRCRSANARARARAGLLGPCCLRPVGARGAWRGRPGRRAVPARLSPPTRASCCTIPRCSCSPTPRSPGRIRAVVEHSRDGRTDRARRAARRSCRCSSPRDGWSARPGRSSRCSRSPTSISFSVVQTELNDGSASWHALPVDGGEKRSRLAGWWYALVSVPLFQFLFMRWIFRGIVWAPRARAHVADGPAAWSRLHPGPGRRPRHSSRLRPVGLRDPACSARRRRSQREAGRRGRVPRRPARVRCTPAHGGVRCGPPR